MAKKSKLEQISIEARNTLLTKNTFTGLSEENKYSRGHSRALSDEDTPVHGKGTGKELDTSNGGGSVDINGDAGMLGSGRKGNIKFNIYNSNNQYQKPGMSGDLGEE